MGNWLNVLAAGVGANWVRRGIQSEHSFRGALQIATGIGTLTVGAVRLMAAHTDIKDRAVEIAATTLDEYYTKLHAPSAVVASKEEVPPPAPAAA